MHDEGEFQFAREAHDSSSEYHFCADLTTQVTGITFMRAAHDSGHGYCAMKMKNKSDEKQR